MPPYLPIRAIDRNRQLRIGGQVIKTNSTSYIDLGQLPIPVGLQATETTSGGAGLASGGVYKYVVTAVDQYGGETPASAEVSITLSADTTSFVTLRWLPIVDVNGNYVEPVGGYNVYRTTNGGVSGSEAFLANVSGNSIYNDGAAQTVAWGTTVSTTVNPAVSQLGVANTAPNTVNNTYTQGETGFNMRKELANHSAMGAYFIVGALMNRGSDVAFSILPTLGLATLTITPSGGEFVLMSTGVFAPVLTTTTVLVTKPAAGSERYDVVGMLPSGLVINITGPVTTQVGNAVLPSIDTRNTGQITQTPVTTTSGNAVLSVANTAGIQVGAVVTGAGIPLTSGSYTYVLAVTPNVGSTAGSVTLSANATASATVTATFTNFCPLAVYLVNNAAATVFATPYQYAPRV